MCIKTAKKDHCDLQCKKIIKTIIKPKMKLPYLIVLKKRITKTKSLSITLKRWDIGKPEE